MSQKQCVYSRWDFGWHFLNENFFHFSIFSHDVWSNVFFSQEMSSGLHKRLLSLLGVIPDLSCQAQNAHGIPRIDLGFSHSIQRDSTQFGIQVMAELAKICSGRHGWLSWHMIIVQVVIDSPLIFFIFIFLIFLKARIAKIVSISVAAAVISRITMSSSRRRWNRWRRRWSGPRRISISKKKQQKSHKLWFVYCHI